MNSATDNTTTHAYIVQPRHVVEMTGGVRASEGDEIALTEADAAELGAAVQRKAPADPADPATQAPD